MGKIGYCVRWSYDLYAGEMMRERGIEVNRASSSRRFNATFPRRGSIVPVQYFRPLRQQETVERLVRAVAGQGRRRGG